MIFGGAERITRSKPEEAGSSNPDPTMKSPSVSPKSSRKGENMPPSGGEDIAPAEGTRSPEATQKQIKRDDRASGD